MYSTSMVNHIVQWCKSMSFTILTACQKKKPTNCRHISGPFASLQMTGLMTAVVNKGAGSSGWCHWPYKEHRETIETWNGQMMSFLIQDSLCSGLCYIVCRNGRPTTVNCIKTSICILMRNIWPKCQQHSLFEMCMFVITLLLLLCKWRAPVT